MKNRKTLLGLFCILLGVSVITGCSSKEGTVNGKKIEKIDAPINSFRVLGKEIYLTTNTEDFVLQFQGLGCSFYPDDSYSPYRETDKKIAIDDIKSKDNAFYTANGDQYVQIVCPIERDSENTEIVQLQFTNNDSDLYVDREIVSWIARDNIEIGSGKNIIYVGDNKHYSQIKDVERIFGTNHETEMDIIHRDEVDSIKYKTENGKYQIDFQVFYPTLSKEYDHYINSVWVKKIG